MRKLLSAVAIVLALTLFSAPVKADYILHYKGKGNDGKTYHYYTVITDKDVTKGTYVYDEKGKYVGFVKPKGNPNPESDGKGINPPDVKSLAEHDKGKGQGKLLTPEFWTTAVGKHLISKGIGPAVINPGPDDAEGGHHTSPTTKKSPQEILKEQREQAIMAAPGKTFEVQPNAGSPSDQLKGMAGKKGQKGGASKPDKKDTKAVGATFGDLPGPPELVNPAPAGGKAKAQKAKAKTGDKATANAETAGPPEGSKGTAKTALKCAPNMAPNASGKSCVPKLDMSGFDSSLGSSPGAGRGAAAGAAGGAGTPAGRR